MTLYKTLREHESVTYTAADTWAPALIQAYPESFEGRVGPGPHNTLRARSYIGSFPVLQDGRVRVLPKVPIRNVLLMWEYVYGLPVRLFDQHDPSDIFEEVINVVARQLCTLVHQRIRRGLHRDYVAREVSQAAIRGRLNVPTLSRQVLHDRAPCIFDEHTADVPHNQVIAYALEVAGQSELARLQTIALLRRTRRLLPAEVNSIRCEPETCMQPAYSRLNRDYVPIHQLCRFILEHCGPVLQDGNRLLRAFAINMNQLFERFVACWLEANLGTAYRVFKQQEITLHGGPRIRIDLLVKDARSGKSLLLLDTKYKYTDCPSPEDIAQVNLYLDTAHCHRAFLVYPCELSKHLRAEFPRGNESNKVIQSAHFDLSQDLTQAGRQLFVQLGIAG